MKKNMLTIQMGVCTTCKHDGNHNKGLIGEPCQSDDFETDTLPDANMADDLGTKLECPFWELNINFDDRKWQWEEGE